MVRSASVQHAIATCCKRRGKERKKLSNQSVRSLRVERKIRQIKAYDLCFVRGKSCPDQLLFQQQHIFRSWLICCLVMSKLSNDQEKNLSK